MDRALITVVIDVADNVAPGRFSFYIVGTLIAVLLSDWRGTRSH